MKSVSAKLPDVAAKVIVLILVLIPFHALLTVWIGGSFGAYEASRLWKEVLILALMPVAAYLVCKDRRLYEIFRNKIIFWLIAAYVLLHLFLGLLALARGEVTGEALGYALIVNLRFLAFFFICWVIASKAVWLKERLPVMVLLPAVLVVGFGLLQVFALPLDALKSFGYGPETIAPYQTVDQKLDYQRIQSTLRGSNPLGAYLVLIASVAAAFVMTHYKSRKQTLVGGGLLVACLLALGFTYSRSAYIGVAITLVVLGWLLSSGAVRRWLMAGLVSLVLISATGFALFRENNQLQNIVFHTDETSQSANSSNEVRLGAQKQALEEVIRQPLGMGPGTAGPASQHNDQGPRIAENYYLQIGQETGWLGLGLLVGILLCAAKALWELRRAALGAALLASLLGITFINLVSHAWTDDTLSLLWWGAAGILLAPAILDKSKHNETR